MKIHVTIAIFLLALSGCSSDDQKVIAAQDAGESSTTSTIVNYTSCAADSDCPSREGMRCINQMCTRFCEDDIECGKGWSCSESCLVGSMLFEDKLFCVPGCEVYNEKCSVTEVNPVIMPCDRRCWIDDENCELHCLSCPVPDPDLDASALGIHANGRQLHQRRRD